SGVKPPGPLRHATGSYPDHETATGDISRNLNLYADEVKVFWQALLRRSDIEHTFRMLKQTLG
ncbi:hypothetical protein, partial [Nocardia sp. NPDC003963]